MRPVLVLVLMAAAVVVRERVRAEVEGPLTEEEKADPELNQALDTFMDMVSRYRVVIAGKKNCQMTDRVKAAFADLNEQPHVLDLDTMQQDEGWLIRSALRRWLGYWITPQIFVHGMHYGGAELLLDNHKTGLLGQHLKETKSEL